MNVATTGPSAAPATAPASASDDRIALLDSNGNIVGVNDKWLIHVDTDIAVPCIGAGANYLEVCRRASSSCSDAREALSGIEAVLQDRLRSFTMDYSGDSSSQHFRMSVMPIHYESVRCVVSHTDITELRKSRDESLQRLQEFTRRLIHAQEEERARLAREIHDDLGNRIALLSLAVGQAANRQTEGSGRPQKLNEIMDKVADLAHAMRNLAHCLHPPLLKQAGICVALRSLCEEFARSQDVEMDVSIPDRLPDLPDEVVLCIFRVSQECLHNIARHARTSKVRVVLEKTPREVRLRVSDTGQGFVPSDNPVKAGLGLINIKERVLCLKGHFEIESSPGAGAKVSVTIPLLEKQ